MAALPSQGRLFAAAKTLALDAAAAAVFDLFRELRIPAVLLKGPVTTRWLYRSDEVRSYGDADVLVPAARLADAEAALAGLGFEQRSLARLDDRASRNCVWQRKADGVTVDLQTVFWGATVRAERQWELMTAEAETMSLAGTNVAIPGPAAKAVQIALHAAKHGSGTPKPIEDLRRALERLTLEEWSAAARLATELGATRAFSWGLRLLPRGAEVADKLGLGTVVDTELLLRNDLRSARSVGFEVFLGQRRGASAKLAYLADRLLPPPGAMRFRYRFAGRGPGGLVLAYLLHPFALLWQLAMALPPWLRARRSSR